MERFVLATMILDFVASFFASATALLPIFANEILKVGPQGLGILYAAQPVGAVIAGATILFLGNIKRSGMVFLIALICYGAATALQGRRTPVPQRCATRGRDRAGEGND